MIAAMVADTDPWAAETVKTGASIPFPGKMKFYDEQSWTGSFADTVELGVQGNFFSPHRKALSCWFLG